MFLKPTLRAALVVASFAHAAHAAAQTIQKDPPAPVVAAEKPVAPDQSKKDAAYEALLKRIKDGDKTVDFKELRMAYAESSRYSPYGGDSEAQKAMFAAMRASQWDEVLKQSAKILEKNYVDINAHFGAFVANHEKGITDKAFVVISTDEEYALLNYLDLRPMGQALINSGGHSYDKLTAVDPKTNEKYELFFNIDKPFGWLGNSLKH